MTGIDPLRSLGLASYRFARQDVRMPRRNLIALIALSANCCAPLPRAETRPALVIDLGNHRATTPQWQSEIVDCSDASFECLEAPGHFLMAFPKTCPTTWDWNIAGSRYRLTAPMEHFGLPSGGYVSYKYPYAYLIYQADAGFISLWMRTHPVFSGENWGGPSVIEYDIKYVGGQSPFRCRSA